MNHFMNQNYMNFYHQESFAVCNIYIYTFNEQKRFSPKRKGLSASKQQSLPHYKNTEVFLITNSQSDLPYFRNFAMAQILLSAIVKKDGFHPSIHPSTNPEKKLVFDNQAQFPTTLSHCLALFSP